MSLARRSLAGLMNQPLTTTTADTTVHEALSLAGGQRIHHLPVTVDGMLVGLVCTCDLYDARLDSPIGDVMKKPIVLDAASSALQAAQLMQRHGIGSVIVMQEGRPQGIVTRGDILMASPDGDAVMGPSRCECCGLTRHLRTNDRGQTLCLFCSEGASTESWFDLDVAD
jgi:CBS domain-containing protein